MLHNNLLGTIGQLGRSFGLWEPETPVQIRVVPLCIYPTQLNLAERWTVDPNVAGSSPAVGIFIIITNLFYSIGVSFRIFKFFLKWDQYKHLYIIINILFYEYNLLTQFALVVQGLSCGPVEPATRVQIPARALNYMLSKIATLNFICLIRARSSVWQSAWLLTKRPRVQFPSGPL